MVRFLIAFALLGSTVPNSHLISEEPLLQVDTTDAFTGRVRGDRVRLRLQPNLESGIVCELPEHQLLEVVGHADDFYAIRALPEQKFYLFRTFVLDGVVEGNRVNIRLAPSLDAPVVAQLSSGDRVDGRICSDNKKWIEISAPDEVRFFIACEYIEQIGDSHYLTTLRKREEEARHLLQSAHLMTESELSKPFEEMSLRNIVTSYETLLADYQDLPAIITEAETQLEQAEATYAAYRLKHLEAIAAERAKPTPITTTSPLQIEEEIASAAAQIDELKIYYEESSPTTYDTPKEASPKPLFARQAIWEPVEQALFEQWLQTQVEESSIYEFYASQKKESVEIHGILEPYHQPIKNKPGDYILRDPITRVPIAFLYSTSVDLHGLVGAEITLEAAPRANHNFAYPAFYALKVL